MNLELIVVNTKKQIFRIESDLQGYIGKVRTQFHRLINVHPESSTTHHNSFSGYLNNSGAQSNDADIHLNDADIHNNNSGAHSNKDVYLGERAEIEITDEQKKQAQEKSDLDKSDLPSVNTRTYSFDERGDVPGWVLVVLMTTGLVTAIWTIAAPRLSAILKNSLDAMNGIR